MKKTNASLAQFSSFISTNVVVGLVSLLIGIVLFFMNSNSFNPAGIFFAGFFLYISSVVIGLAIVGAFLRQTAKVIVEGMDGNLNELDFRGEDVSARTDSKMDSVPAQAPKPSTKEDLHKIRVGWLTGAERARWEALGRPDISAWDGTVKFSKWVEQQGNK